MTVSVPPTTSFPCPRCGNILAHGDLACPRCGGLVYARELTQLANEAQREESAGNVVAASGLWRRMLTMLPGDSRQYQEIARHTEALTSQFAARAMQQGGPYAGPNGAGGSAEAEAAGPAVVKPNDPWRVAVLKTGGSMLISILAYAVMFSQVRGWSFGFLFATGFAILILVHELGHSVAMRYFGLSASPPIFIPFLGAVINLRQPPRDALEEAIVGIAGPVFGTIGAGIAYLLYLRTGSELMLLLAQFNFLLNLFNMMPVPPLDGGRVTAAVSPWIWLPAILAVAIYVAYGFFFHGRLNPIWILLLLMAWPRVIGILRAQNRQNPYYRIGWKAKWTMGAAYALLSIVLMVMYFLANVEGAVRFR